MIIRFDKPVCQKHKEPLSFICKDLLCKCSTRLCYKCASVHHKGVNVDEDFIKENVFANKLEIETEIIAKQYKHLEKYQKCQEKGSSLLSSKNQENIVCVEMLMKGLNEDKRAVNRDIDDFNTNHFEVKKKLNKVKSSHSGNYLAELTSKKINPIIIYLSSDKGLQKLWSRVSASQIAIQKYNDFLNAVKKYGSKNKQFIEGLGHKDNTLFRTKIQRILSEWKGDQKVELCLNLYNPQNQIAERQRCNSRTPRTKLDSPRKKIFMITDRPRAVSGKQN